MKIATQHVSGEVIIRLEGDDTEQLQRIIMHHLPDLLEKFAAKNQQYGENEFELGVAGQFPEIWRKVRLLRKQIWEDRTATIDSNTEIAEDLIGHLLILLDCLHVAEEQAPDQPMRYAESVDEPPLSDMYATAIKYGVDIPPPPRYHPSYTVAELIAVVKEHRLPMAPTDDKRCEWYYGDGRLDSQRCLGFMEHDEPVHINQDGQAWL